MNVFTADAASRWEGTRKPYSAPQLTVYGDIRIITKTLARTVSAADGVGSRTTA